MTRAPFLLDLSDWAVFRLTGGDSVEFLQGVGTQDVAGIAPGRAEPTLFLTEKGRPVALGWASLDGGGDGGASGGGGVTLFVEPGGRDALLPHLERLRVMEDVEFAGPNGMPRLYGVGGDGREETVRQWAHALPDAEAISADPMTFVLVPPGAERPGGVARLLTLATPPDAAEVWRLEQGVPRAGVDFDLERIATELSLPQAISTTKGCFVGQEVVARTSNRGAVRRRRVGFRYVAAAGAGAIPPRAEIVVESAGARRVVGFVTSAAVDTMGGRGVGMGYLSTEVADGSAALFVIRGVGAPIPIEVAPWPL
jgi:folate-binding protein YgfZ